MSPSANDQSVSALIIGAMKCGTTQLFHTLAAHPEVNACAIKEPNFFVDHASGSWSKGSVWYRSLFRDSSGIRLEASTAYTKEYLDQQTALRIRSYCPKAKLIYLIRDPVDRAISHYLHNVTEGREDRPLLEALLDRGSVYNSVSLYYRQLTPFLSLFPRDQICVVQAESLWKAPEETIAGVRDFLGISPKPLLLSPNRHSTADRIRHFKQFSLSVADRESWLPEIQPATTTTVQALGARVLGEMLGLTHKVRSHLEEYFESDLRHLHQVRLRKMLWSQQVSGAEIASDAV